MLPDSRVSVEAADLTVALRSISLATGPYIKIDFAVTTSTELDEACISLIALSFASEEFAEQLIAYNDTFDQVSIKSSYFVNTPTTDSEVVREFKTWPRAIRTETQEGRIEYTVSVLFHTTQHAVRYVRMSPASSRFFHNVIAIKECECIDSVSTTTDWHAVTR